MTDQPNPILEYRPKPLRRSPLLKWGIGIVLGAGLVFVPAFLYCLAHSGDPIGPHGFWLDTLPAFSCGLSPLAVLVGAILIVIGAVKSRGKTKHE